MAKSADTVAAASAAYRRAWHCASVTELLSRRVLVELETLGQHPHDPAATESLTRLGLLLRTASADTDAAVDAFLVAGAAAE